MIGDTGVCPKCKTEFTIALETAVERHSRIRCQRFFGAIPLPVIGIWILCAGGIAMSAGGLAILPCANVAAGIFVTICGIGKARGWRDQLALYVLAAVATLLSWFIFSVNRDWESAYRMTAVLADYGYSDPYDLKARSAFGDRVERGEIKVVEGPDSIRAKIEREKSHDVSFAELLEFKLYTYCRLALWPPLPFIRERGCRYVFDGTRAENGTGQASPFE